MSENKTLQALHKALAKVNGYNESVAVIYCDNKAKMYQAGYVGDTDATCAGFQCMLDKVGDGTATPGEMAITRAMLTAIAAADIRRGGSVMAAIVEYKRQMQEPMKGALGEALDKSGKVSEVFKVGDA